MVYWVIYSMFQLFITQLPTQIMKTHNFLGEF